MTLSITNGLYAMILTPCPYDPINNQRSLPLTWTVPPYVVYCVKYIDLVALMMGVSGYGAAGVVGARGARGGGGGQWYGQRRSPTRRHRHQYYQHHGHAPDHALSHGTVESMRDRIGVHFVYFYLFLFVWLVVSILQKGHRVSGNVDRFHN